MGVDGGRINVHVGMRFLDALDAFGSAHEIEAEDALAAALLEEIDRGDERAAGRQHGIKDNGDALVDLLGELHVVLYGLQRLFVPVQADDADLRARDHVQHAVHQAEPGPENGNDGHHLAGNGFHFHGPGPAFDGPLFGLELLGGFIHEQPGDFLGQHTEFAGGGGFLPKDAQFVPHERMINYMNRHTHSPLNKRIPETLPKHMGPPKREANPIQQAK